ncbi:ArnT family glycosyltransferase [Amycolatopsis anabasis]|uniref:ArnT family glycosyltransferase n=1 Tax=Amycolatopsis anabasis TaxID=1840409 RepID=UPI00131A8788|nr:glycosyltransferase family 39 protein [Amycolatopsis anabasis]
MTSAPALSRVENPPPVKAPRITADRAALAVLLIATAALYLWRLGSSGYGNDYYAMAVQAGTQSWKAWFFGALDPGNVITVDKPPAALWLMGLSGRIFGFSSWSMLVPDALAGVASVGLLYAAVRRVSGPAAGLVAGAALALTPVAALMFRYNNPDAVLVLLLVAGAYCTVRATEQASARWLVLAGVAIGFGFLTKMLQAFLVLPAFALVYLVAAPTSFGRRLAHLCAAAGAVIVSAGWWVAAVALWPAASRPYIGGSTTNSALELALGYNGLGRILGGDGDPGGSGPGMMIGPGGSRGFGGEAGLGRMFGESFGLEVSWLLPAALIALIAGLWFTRRAPRTDRTRAAVLLWGGWLVGTGLTFSLMSGIIHPYYTVALAPAAAALTALAGTGLWRGRHNFAARAALALMLAATGVWTFILLSRNGSWHPWLRFLVLVLVAVTVFALLFGADRVRGAAKPLLVAMVCAGLLGMSSYAVATAATSHSGGIPNAGPVSSGFGRPGEPTDDELTALLTGTTTKWAAATGGAQEAAGLALSTGKSIMAIGGFSGRDPAPALERFQQYVANGEVRYFLAGGRTRGGANEIATWVEDTFTPLTVGGTTVYDLTRPR